MFFSDLQVETLLSVTKYTLFETVLVTVATLAADRTHCFEASQFVGRLMVLSIRILSPGWKLSVEVGQVGF
jgi:hypothetical protein